MLRDYAAKAPRVLAVSTTRLPLFIALGSLGTLSATATHSAAAEENPVYPDKKTIAAYSPARWLRNCRRCSPATRRTFGDA